MAAKRQEFKVVVEGIDLDDKHREALSRAVHQAAVTELAASDFKGDFASLRLAGRLDGRQLRALSQEQLQRAGLHEG